ncbi:hypothetical protein LY28_02036 [Ruminiclostridium sufflavum DSM 19573]|uniref:Uncharacterized protein n=1 Tax=Ruminiclostridium sufflavum DSM 19573 TaxID=1121337 RepID=A0A318XJC8_9FIRM|nr:hypothetical protein [Ruminiclostridium sufflavum]PYG87369.1 hypothetical protein LY28_02036 [Ruminiclostridium sufflavum DSM 19573]
MVTEKIVEGCRVVNFVPDMDENERKNAERETARNILREYNRLEEQACKAAAHK